MLKAATEMILSDWLHIYTGIFTRPVMPLSDIGPTNIAEILYFKFHY